ncbi:kelch domain-containing protein 8a [Ophiocordyceps camponoti-floridani]|uniref:Kelch domain-containing protein 8a n=1 Tax=Ophiocordyceps camponoti-floridani TaxID=2030778 RepID=A0A8H4VBT1_9HYPO|nr:kelch domain-containing protein 8a [Ophiocordyceps camponoti-floridani]
MAVLGGLTNVTTAMVQFYDMPSNTWSSGPDIPMPLNHLNAAVVNGNIYLLGGLAVLPNGTWSAIPYSWVYKPAEGYWKPISPMPEGTARGSAVTVPYGNTIFLAGGETINVPGAYQDSTDIVSSYDTIRDEWRVLPARLPEPRQHATGAIVDDVMYLIGGRTGGRRSVKDNVYALNLKRPDGQWESRANMPTPRGGIMGGVVGKSIYVFGGEGNPVPGTDGVFDDTTVFDTVTGNWSVLEPMQKPRHGSQAVSVNDCIYIPGGSVVEGGPTVEYSDKFCP